MVSANARRGEFRYEVVGIRRSAKSYPRLPHGPKECGSGLPRETPCPKSNTRSELNTDSGNRRAIFRGDQSPGNGTFSTPHPRCRLGSNDPDPGTTSRH